MTLHKNLFDDAEENAEILIYMYENPNFIVHEICDKFGYKYQTFFNHLLEWMDQEFIIGTRQPPGLGKIKYKYSLSEKAIKKLYSIKKIWNRLKEG